MAPHVQTVTGPVPADSLGFSLPHEHTRCVLWHIPNRWDYWELTGEDELILPELARFRDAGGTCLADLTLREIGRDPLAPAPAGRGVRAARSSWAAAGTARATTRPRRWIDRRSVEDLADELVREFEEGADGTDVRPGIIGEIGTDKPWLSRPGGARLPGRRPGVAGDRHGGHHARRDERRRAGPARVMEDAGADPGRVVVGHADSYPDLEHYLRDLRARGEHRVRLPGHELHAPGAQARRG